MRTASCAYPPTDGAVFSGERHPRSLRHIPGFSPLPTGSPEATNTSVAAARGVLQAVTGIEVASQVLTVQSDRRYVSRFPRTDSRGVPSIHSWKWFYSPPPLRGRPGPPGSSGLGAQPALLQSLVAKVISCLSSWHTLCARCRLWTTEREAELQRIPSSHGPPEVELHGATP